MAGTKDTKAKGKLTDKADNGVLPQEEIDRLLSSISSANYNDCDDSNDSDGEISQEEIDALLSGKAPAKPKAKAEAKPAKTNQPNRKIKAYDFKRPDAFTKRQLRVIEVMFETVCRKMTTRFSSQLRTLCHFHVASVDQLTYEEFIRSIPTPTILAIQTWGKKEKTAIEIDPDIAKQMLYTNVTTMLFEEYKKIEGSYTEKKEKSASQKTYESFRQRLLTNYGIELTPQELSTLKATAIKRIVKYMRKAFVETNKRLENLYVLPAALPASGTGEIKLPKAKTTKMETNPQFAQIVPPPEMTILITIEAKIGDECGMINVAMPKPFINNILIKQGVLMPAVDTIHSEQHVQSLKQSHVNSAVSLGMFNVPDGKKLSEGMIFELDKLSGETVDLFDIKSGRIFAKAEVVVIDENFAVRITEVLDPVPDAKTKLKAKTAAKPKTPAKSRQAASKKK